MASSSEEDGAGAMSISPSSSDAGASGVARGGLHVGFLDRTWGGDLGRRRGSLGEGEGFGMDGAVVAAATVAGDNGMVADAIYALNDSIMCGWRCWRKENNSLSLKTSMVKGAFTRGV